MSSLSNFILKMVSRLIANGQQASFRDDLTEEFYIRLQSDGQRSALFWLWIHLIRSLPTVVGFQLFWRIIMWKHYLKTSFRMLFKTKGYSSINIFGLAVGFACSMLIGLFVSYELSYDRFHVNADRIFRVTMTDEVSTPPAMARALARDFPEIEYATCFSNLRIQPVKYEEHIFYESPVLGTTNECFHIFSFKLLAGDRNTVLKEPNTVVLTESMSTKYFPNEDPLHKMIIIGDNTYRVDGVMEDVPENAHFTFRCLVSNKTFPWGREDWWNTSFMSTYVMLHHPTDITSLNDKLPDFETKYVYDGDPDHKPLYMSQPLTSIHLHSHLRFELGQNGDYKNIIIFTTAAIFMIIIACINFMNLTTARSLVRVREIGIRKTVGSTRKQLIHQFLGESLLLSLVAFIIGIMMVLFLLPTFCHLIGKPIGIGSINMDLVLPGLIGFSLMIGLLAGVYPAIFLSSYSPVQVMKNVHAGGKRSVIFRNGMVIFQFLVSSTLIIGTLTVYRQLHLIQNKNIGFDKEQVLVIKNLHPDILKSEALKQRLLQHPDVVAVSASGNLPGKGNGRNWIATEDEDTLIVNSYFTDFNYADVLQLQLIEGRFFSREFSTDTAGIILNAHAVRANNIKDPVGKRVTFYYGRPIPMTVIGVVEDFHFESLHQPLTSLAIFYGINKGWGINFISVRLRTEHMQNLVKFVEQEWKAVNPAMPFDYSFLDDEYDAMYTNEIRTGKVAFVFCLLAVAVSCLGLFGLSIFIIEQRVKEIGIRKVLGESIIGAVWLLSCQSLKWIILAFVLSIPLSLFVMQHWLQNFAYRVSMDPWIFLLSGALAVLIAFLTVSTRSIKAAMANPVDSLRTE